MKLSFFVMFAAFVALSPSFASAGFNIVVDQDNAVPFFIGNDKLVGVSSAVSSASNNPALSSVLDSALTKKYDSATVTAWRRLMSGNGTLVATAGPALSGEIKCFIGTNGEITGLQYGTAVVCKPSNRVVNVKIGKNYVSNIKVILGKNAMIAGLQFIVTNGVSGMSTATWCGTKNGLSAYIGKAGESVGALGGTCIMGTTGRRRLAQNNNGTTPATPGLVGSSFTSIVTPAPQGENNSPPFSPSTTFIIDGKTVSGGNITNGTSGRRLRLRRSLLAAALEN